MVRVDDVFSTVIEAVLRWERSVVGGRRATTSLRVTMEP
jgi:hypothetical protein